MDCRTRDEIHSAFSSLAELRLDFSKPLVVDNSYIEIPPFLKKLPNMVRLRDGMWLPAEGTTTEYAEEVYYTTEIESGKGLSLLCPTRKIKSRGHALNVSTVTIVSRPNLSYPLRHVAYTRTGCQGRV